MVKKPTVSDQAETITGALREVMDGMERWKFQRIEIAKQLEELVRAAQTIVESLNSDNERGHDRAKNGRRKGYVVSPETKAKLRAAWVRRKDAGAGTTKRTMTPEGRARIVAAQKARWAKVKRVAR